jgi:hypothetical protein
MVVLYFGNVQNVQNMIYFHLKSMISINQYIQSITIVSSILIYN